MKKQLLYLLAVTAVAAMVFVTGCQKETSFEGSNNPAKGSLAADGTGDCLPKTVNGIYAAGTALIPATNTITVQVNVTQTGTYVVTTDTVNGYFFRATGTFTTLGAATVTLRGNGTPFAQGINNFVVSFDGTVCDIAVTVMPSGTGPATFTLVSGGAPPNCASAVVAGTYTQNVALVPTTNYVDIQVNVTVIGSYTITATGGGMTFSKTSSFATTGPQSVRLDGTGTPTTSGANTVTFAAPFASCSFTVTVAPGAGPATFTLVNGGAPPNCASAVVSGTYTQNVALVAATNYVDITVNVTVIGSYTISATGGGMTFSKTGTFATTGNQTVRLDGSGTPTGSGAVTVTFAAPFASCSFTVNVTAAGGPATFAMVNGGTPPNCASASVSGFYVMSTALVPANNYVDITVNVTATGTYTITATGGGMTFTKSGTFATTGNQTVRLDGSGTPTTVGYNTITFAAPFASCTFTVYVLPNDYYPRTVGSNWSYEYDNVADDSIYRFVHATPFNNGANTYARFMFDDNTGPDSSGYYRRNGGDYFEWFDFGSFVGLDNPIWTDYILLKDNVPLNTNWKTGAVCGTVTGTPICVRWSYTIKLKDGPFTVTSSAGAVTYQNVIMVEEKLDYSLDGGANWLDATSTVDYYAKSYYARGIGLIQFEVYDAGNVEQFRQELRRFQIY